MSKEHMNAGAPEGEAMPMMNTENNQQGQNNEYGCLFCRTGYEKKLLSILRVIDGFNPLLPEKIARRRTGGQFVEETVILFPGYIFFQANGGFDIHSLSEYSDVIRVLTNSCGEWPLQGADKEFAQWLFQNDGCFGLSQAFYVGDRIRIISGPLKDLEGQIKKVNRRFQSGLVVLRFGARDMNVWLNFSIVKEC